MKNLYLTGLVPLNRLQLYNLSIIEVTIQCSASHSLASVDLCDLCDGAVVTARFQRLWVRIEFYGYVFGANLSSGVRFTSRSVLWTLIGRKKFDSANQNVMTIELQITIIQFLQDFQKSFFLSKFVE